MVKGFRKATYYGRHDIDYCLVWMLLGLFTVAAVAEKRVVRSALEFRDALNDSRVDHVVLAQIPGGYSLLEEEFPENGLWLDGRTVVVEGEGPDRVYMDGNHLASRIHVSNGAVLDQRNLWADDCFRPDDLVICFSKIHDDGRVLMMDMELSDAFCLEVGQSTGMKAMIDTIRYLRLMGLAGGRELPDSVPVIEELSPRETYISDSGWISFPVGSHWRIINTTFSCTANITHALPSSFQPRMVWSVWTVALAGAACFLGTLATAVGLWIFLWRRSRDSDSSSSGLAKLPEQTVANSHGYTLLRLLGVGHYGRVFLAEQSSSSELFAIKVITVYTVRQLEAAYAECRTMLAIRHPNCARVHTYFSARMEHRLRPVSGEESGTDSDYLEQAFSLEPMDGNASPRHTDVALQGSSGSPAGSFGLGQAVSLSGSGSGVQAKLSGGPWLNSGSSLSGSGRSSTVADCPASFAMQVHMVVDFCDMGTLEAAILGGAFEHPVMGKPRLDWILATAVDMAAGLEYLHSPPRRFVHRDLSAGNILLRKRENIVGDGDGLGSSDRPFYAVISDFGLSMMLSAHATHRTTQMKGTVIYMSPEVFQTNDVTQALDVYSLGIILYYLYVGELPYRDRSPGQVILEKMREAQCPSDERFEIPEHCPREYRDIILDCTNPYRRERPTITDLLRRLRELWIAMQPN